MATKQKANAEPVRVALWCVPRSSSTVFSKCLCSIEDITVFSELYTYAATCRSIFQTSTGRKIPAALDGNEKVYTEAFDLWEKTTGSRLSTEKLSYENLKEEMERACNKYIIMREMAGLADDFLVHLPSGLKHTFLIREPSRVYASFRKVMISKFASALPTNFDIVNNDVLKIEPLMLFEKQYKLWRHVVDNIDPDPVIIDAYDLLSRPRPTLRAYCEAVGFPYSDDLLQWEAGLELPENMVIPGPQVYKDMIEFYETAFNSTHFMAPQESGPIPRDQLTDDVIRCVDYSMPFYQKMHQQKLKV